VNKIDNLKTIEENLKKMGWKPIFRVVQGEVTHLSENELENRIAADPTNMVGEAVAVIDIEKNELSVVKITQIKFDAHVYAVMAHIEGQGTFKVLLDFSDYLEDPRSDHPNARRASNCYLVSCERS
jgi:uncharacterized protein YhfF